jgi:hypothetical protein
MRRRLRDDAGNAALEFLTAGVLLLVPLVYLALALAALQGAALAVEGAAREAARAYVSAATDAEGRGAADRAVTVALADRHLARTAGDLTLSCDTGGDCLADGQRVTAVVRATVPLPLVPAVFGFDRAARIQVRAAATAPVFRLGEGP